MHGAGVADPWSPVAAVGYTVVPMREVAGHSHGKPCPREGFDRAPNQFLFKMLKKTGVPLTFIT